MCYTGKCDKEGHDGFCTVEDGKQLPCEEEETISFVESLFKINIDVQRAIFI